jgi:predicted nucleic acid-binding Zn ribbon protein
VKRLAPRPLARALEAAVPSAEPATLIARVQTAWPAAVGEVVAAETEPASEREGVVTVRCSSSLWASELDLMQADLAASLNAELGSSEPASPVSRLRFLTVA